MLDVRARGSTRLGCKLLAVRPAGAQGRRHAWEASPRAARPPGAATCAPDRCSPAPGAALVVHPPQEMFKRVSEQFTAMFRRKAFLHWYTGALAPWGPCSGLVAGRRGRGAALGAWEVLLRPVPPLMSAAVCLLVHPPACLTLIHRLNRRGHGRDGIHGGGVEHERPGQRVPAVPGRHGGYLPGTADTWARAGSVGVGGLGGGHSAPCVHPPMLTTPWVHPCLSSPNRPRRRASTTTRREPPASRPLADCRLSA